MIYSSWNLKELTELHESARQLVVDLNGIGEKLQDEHCDWVEKNIL